MKPLNRKMFRQPGMSRQPMGILASSPELANVVRRRMGQPVRMAHGGYHPPSSPMGRLTTSRRPVPGDVRIPLIDALPKSGFARPALDRFLASADNIPSSGIAAIRPDVVKRGQDLAQISSADRSENTGNSFSDIMAMIRDAIPDPKGYASSPAAAKAQFTKSFLGPALQTTPQELSASLQDDPDINVIPDFEVASSSLPDDDLMASEQLAAEDGSGAKTTDATGRQVSTVDPKAKPKPSKKVEKKKTAVEAALDIALKNETADAQAEKTVIGAKTNENIDAAIASALETQQSNATDKEKAEATDSILGITAKNRKERVKARQALIKEILGEDKAKDMRTDANYNLIMLGLLTATGQSSSALANFAEAAKLTLGSYAKVVGEKSEAKRKEDRAIALKAIDEVGAEISVEEKRAYENLIRADEQQFRKDLQEQKDVAALERLDRQLTSAEQRQVDEFKFKRDLNNRTFRQNIAMLGIKAENAEALQQMNNDFKMELQELKNQEDSAAIKTARILQASNPTKYPTLDDAYAATKALSTTRPTDEQQRYNRLVASGMLPSQAIIFAQTGVTTEMFKQMGVEKAQEAIGGLMGGVQTAAPATITIADLPEAKRNQISKYKPGETVPTKQGNYLVTNAGTLVPVR